MASSITRDSTSTVVTRKINGDKTRVAITAAKQKKRSTHTKARPIDHIAFDQPGMLRVGHLMTAFNLSHSGLYKGMELGHIPQPDGYYGGTLGPSIPVKKTRRTPYWFTSTVRPMLGSKE